MLEHHSGALPIPQIQRLADARRILEINCDHPFMTPEGRNEIRQAKRIAWATIAEVAEMLVDTLDAAAGDPDVELNGDELDGDYLSEDEFMEHGGFGPGCPLADDDTAVDDMPCDAFSEDGL